MLSICVNYYNFFFFFAVISAGVFSVAGPCSESLGVCGTDCDKRCQQKNGQGSCDYTLNPPLCTCYYPCGTPSPPQPKFCDGGAGVCNLDLCWHDCCNAKCAKQYPKGVGSCDSSASPAPLCQCLYPC